MSFFLLSFSSLKKTVSWPQGLFDHFKGPDFLAIPEYTRLCTKWTMPQVNVHHYKGYWIFRTYSRNDLYLVFLSQKDSNTESGLAFHFIHPESHFDSICVCKQDSQRNPGLVLFCLVPVSNRFRDLPGRMNASVEYVTHGLSKFEHERMNGSASMMNAI